MMFRRKRNIKFLNVNKNSKTRYNISRLTCKILELNIETKNNSKIMKVFLGLIS